VSYKKNCSFIYKFAKQSSFVTVFFKFGGPEGQVVSDKLHDGCGILVLVLLDLVNVSNGIVEGLFGELAGFAGISHDFIVEDRVVQGKTESDGVGGLEILFSSLSGGLVGFTGIVSSLLMLSS